MCKLRSEKKSIDAFNSFDCAMLTENNVNKYLDRPFLERYFWWFHPKFVQNSFLVKKKRP